VQKNVEFDALSNEGITSFLLHHSIALTVLVLLHAFITPQGRRWDSILSILQTEHLFTLKELMEKGKRISVIEIAGLACILSALVARRA
jgi:hypothetical protein